MDDDPENSSESSFIVLEYFENEEPSDEMEEALLEILRDIENQLNHSPHKQHQGSRCKSCSFLEISGPVSQNQSSDTDSASLDYVPSLECLAPEESSRVSHSKSKSILEYVEKLLIKVDQHFHQKKVSSILRIQSLHHCKKEHFYGYRTSLESSGSYSSFPCLVPLLKHEDVLSSTDARKGEAVLSHMEKATICKRFPEKKTANKQDHEIPVGFTEVMQQSGSDQKLEMDSDACFSLKTVRPSAEDSLFSSNQCNCLSTDLMDSLLLDLKEPTVNTEFEWDSSAVIKSPPLYEDDPLVTKDTEIPHFHEGISNSKLVPETGASQDEQSKVLDEYQERKPSDINCSETHGSIEESQTEKLVTEKSVFEMRSEVNNGISLSDEEIQELQFMSLLLNVNAGVQKEKNSKECISSQTQTYETLSKVDHSESSASVHSVYYEDESCSKRLSHASQSYMREEDETSEQFTENKDSDFQLQTVQWQLGSMRREILRLEEENNQLRKLGKLGEKQGRNFDWELQDNRISYEYLPDEESRLWKRCSIMRQLYEEQVKELQVQRKLLQEQTRELQKKEQLIREVESQFLHEKKLLDDCYEKQKLLNMRIQSRDLELEAKSRELANIMEELEARKKLKNGIEELEVRKKKTSSIEEEHKLDSNSASHTCNQSNADKAEYWRHLLRYAWDEIREKEALLEKQRSRFLWLSQQLKETEFLFGYQQEYIQQMEEELEEQGKHQKSSFLNATLAQTSSWLGDQRERMKSFLFWSPPKPSTTSEHQCPVCMAWLSKDENLESHVNICLDKFATHLPI